MKSVYTDGTGAFGIYEYGQELWETVFVSLTVKLGSETELARTWPGSLSPGTAVITKVGLT